MKNKFLLIFLFTNALLCFAASCKKTPVNPNVDQLSQLPPATQTGANTFGCLVNGQAFLPYSKSSFNGPSYQCNYIYLNGGYNFYVGASKDDASGGSGSQVGLTTDLLAISEGQTYNLKAYNIPGNAYGVYNYITGTILTYSTTAIVNGQMHITKLDQTNQIVSGTFYFNAINSSKPDTIHVTDGRFDMKYTQ